jgi:predicted ATP-binding protein involved in virulence
MEKADIKGEIIAEIEVKGIWGKKNISWKPDPHVNILVGINGSGKTTLLNIIYEMLQGKIDQTQTLFHSSYIKSNHDEVLKGDYIVPTSFQGPYSTMSTFFGGVSISGPNHYNFFKISTFDIPRKRSDTYKLVDSFTIKLEEDTELFSELNQIINGDGVSNINFIKLDAINSDRILKLYEAGNTQKAKELQAELSSFFDLINSFFSKTDKKIEFTIDKDIVFKNGDEKITLDKLSAGEKQLLIILFSVYLQQRKPYILLLDEPEISLHLDWQSKLIDTILSINPNCQLFIATHSPSIFGKGWGDKIVHMEDITVS